MGPFIPEQMLKMIFQHFPLPILFRTNFHISISLNIKRSENKQNLLPNAKTISYNNGYTTG